MIRRGFLSREDRIDLIALARDGSAEHRLARRANAIALLDDGLSCAQIGKVLFLDDDTILKWHDLFVEAGLEGLTRFEAGGSACQISEEQQARLVAFVRETLLGSTRRIGAFIEKQFGVAYGSRPGLIALLHRLGLEYRKPEVIPRKLDEAKQKAFIAAYEKLLNSLPDDEAVLFADAPELVEGASNPRDARRRLLGAGVRKAGDRANQRASAHQHSRRHRSGNRSDPHDRGRNHRRRVDHQATGFHRGAASHAGAARKSTTSRKLNENRR